MTRTNSCHKHTDSCHKHTDKTCTVSRIPGWALGQVWPMVTIGIIAANDWILKARWPGWISGKLSDFGLCFLLPIILVSLGEWVTWLWTLSQQRRWTPPGPILSGLACGVTILYFTLLQLSPTWSVFHTAWLHSLFSNIRFVATPDPTDLLALPMVGLAWLYLNPKSRKPHLS